ncbi:MAG: Re/Si-specific NAD(P)(+) transhydrogenase subunit alpha [Gemmatimonadaceae bacterium]|jgi:NAD(P) transhydrogenase subunit alpha|nr:Re/Si-specific NAD(P)(+) transhydrogenase subunit alpha [Gemmatimonadaceae bacterium]
MRISVPKETAPRERRVALTPDAITKLAKAGHAITVERGAGATSFIADSEFEKAGATLADGAAVYAGAEVVARVQKPSADEVARIPEGALLVSLMQPGSDRTIIDALAARRITTLGLELVPRITRAQSMDVLSSQATVSGYKAVLLAASHCAKFLPALTTAAGSIRPAQAFILGAGVAGLQAIATARRLGAVVSAFDVRAAAAEQVKSLGASFVGPAPAQNAEAAGGYARAQSDDEQARTLEAIGAHIVSQDLVVSTAQIPGRTAPRLITADMVRAMKPGSVIVDLAAETGGNCELTQLGETLDIGGVTLIGAANLPSTVPFHASQMFARNVQTLLTHLTAKEGAALVVDIADEITAAMAMVHGADVRRT